MPHLYLWIFYSFLIFFRLRLEAAEVDRQLEVAQQESRRLEGVLQQREDEVQRLRERVAAQRARRHQREQQQPEQSQQSEQPQQPQQPQQSQPQTRQQRRQQQHQQVDFRKVKKQNSLKTVFYEK